MDARWARQTIAAAVSVAMAAAPVLAQAQGAPGPALQPASAVGVGGDPPARVGRIALLSGTVSFHLAGADRWDAASLNLPVTTGGAFWTEPAAKADLDVTGTRLEMAPATELDMVQLDDTAFVTALPQGEVCVKVHGLLPNASVVVQTPRGQVALTKDGRYDVAAGDSGHPTLVTVIEGGATISGAGAQVQAGSNQAATVTGDGQATPFAATLSTAQPDAFLKACLAEDQPARPHTVQVPAEVEQMTGGYVLDETGDWASTPEYGAIWYPPADPGFVPYRHGHWAYIAPWGWTWVDDAAWGFAPSHYGRWVEVQDRWGWIPGGGPLQTGYAAPRYPVYAPAVVSFLAGAAVGALAANALDRGSVGWVPLGPHEPYYPPYRASAGYVRNLNVTHVSNVNTVVNTYNTTINRAPANRGAFSQGPQFGSGPLVNRAAATSVPAAAMAGSQNIAGLARPVPAAALAGGAALVTRPPISPTASTFGVTPAVARQYNIQAAVARPPAPGPALRPAAAPGLGARTAPLSGPPSAAPVAGLPPLRPAGEVRSERPNGGAPGPAIAPRPPGASLAQRPEAAPGAATPEAPRPEPGRPEPGRPEPGRPEPGRPEPGRPEPGRPETQRAEPARPEAAAPRPATPNVAVPNVVRPGPQAAPRPAPAARPMPHVIQPQQPMAAPRPQMAAPRAAPPRAAPPPPRPQAPPPRPQPAPQARPAPRPAPAAGHPHEEHR